MAAGSSSPASAEDETPAIKNTSSSFDSVARTQRPNVPRNDRGEDARPMYTPWINTVGVQVESNSIGGLPSQNHGLPFSPAWRTHSDPYTKADDTPRRGRKRLYEEHYDTINNAGARGRKRRQRSSVDRVVSSSTANRGSVREPSPKQIVEKALLKIALAQSKISEGVAEITATDFVYDWNSIEEALVEEAHERVKWEKGIQHVINELRSQLVDSRKRVEELKEQLEGLGQRVDELRNVKGYDCLG